LAALVAKMMAKDPTSRIQTPSEVAKSLTPFFKKGNVAIQTQSVARSPDSQSSAGQPAGEAVSIPARPAARVASPAVQAKTAAEPTVPDVQGESLIECREKDPRFARLLNRAPAAPAPIRRAQQPQSPEHAKPGRRGPHVLWLAGGAAAIVLLGIVIHRGPNRALRVELDPSTHQVVPRVAVAVVADMSWTRPPWIEPVVGGAMEPSVAEQEPCERAILDEFKRRHGEGKLEERRELARELLDTARALTLRPQERYVRLRLAGRLAAETGAFTSAMHACRELERWFDVDTIRIKSTLLDKHARLADSSQKLDELASASIATGFEAIGLEDYRFADVLIRLAASTAKKTDLQPWIDQSAFLAEEMNAGRYGYAGVRQYVDTLRHQPDNPEASAEVGTFLCLVKNDWRDGLPMLARCNKPALRAVAETELRSPPDPTSQIALGDSWWNLARRNEVPAPRGRLRARTWYLKALALKDKEVGAATVARIRERLNQIPAREFQIRIRAHSLDVNSAVLANDCLFSTENLYTKPRFLMNHLDWNTDLVATRPNTGATRLLPDDIDFTTVEIRDLRITGGEWTDAAQTRVHAREDHARLRFSHWPAGGYDTEFTLAFGRSASAKDLAINPEWDLKFFAWERDELNDPEYWPKLFGTEPLCTTKGERLDFQSQWGAFAPDVPGDFFAMVATTEVELPAGELKIDSFSDDGIRVLVDSQEVFERWTTRPQRGQGVIKVKAGKHVIRVEYFEYDADAFLFLSLKML
jgi:hypothetical protein